MKNFIGNNPEGETWNPVCSFMDSDGIEWMLWKNEQPDDAWKTFKLVAQERVADKANYWACRKADGKVGFSRDLAIMKEHRPQLYAELLDYWREYGND